MASGRSERPRGASVREERAVGVSAQRPACKGGLRGPMCGTECSIRAWMSMPLATWVRTDGRVFSPSFRCQSRPSRHSEQRPFLVHSAVSASAPPSMGRSSRGRSPFTEFDVPDPHSSRISCLSGLLGIFVVLCVGLVALLIAQSRSRQESGAPLFAMAAVVGADASGTMHLYQHDAGVLIDGTITGLAPHSRHGRASAYSATV